MLIYATNNKPMRSLGYFILFVVFMLSCKKKNNPPQISSNSTASYNKNISGTWVLYMYQIENSNMLTSKSDTLTFSFENEYKYNNIAAKYYLNNFNTYNSFRLILYSTSFGNITAIIPDNFESSKEINGALFSPYATTVANQSSYRLWLRKI